MSAAEWKGTGTTLVTRSLIVLFITQFLVLAPSPADQRQLNGKISDARNRLAAERAALLLRLKSLSKQIRQLDSDAPIPASAADLTVADITALRVEQRRKTSDTRTSLKQLMTERDQAVDRLTKINLDDVNLAKARVRRELKVPGTDMAIAESDIRPYYPAALA